ncbi:MAG: hypothetical protein M1833_004111 [Piccolia ochrophora]|nr:MAG: hypothetical protein M1833_004111 [Piccolia ochrophora]
MSSDDAYASFLDKANQDTSSGKATAASSAAATNAINTDVPSALQKVDQYYTSEADEPFEPVSLQWNEPSLPDEEKFKDLVSHKSDVTLVDVKDFDAHGQYSDVIKAVKAAASKDIRIYKLHHGKTRAEYYIVALDEKGSRIVGLKAKAVET